MRMYDILGDNPLALNIADGNPGALAFAVEAYDMNRETAEIAFSKMEKYGIKGCNLYMLWNDCCNRDTRLTIEVILTASIEYIKNHINKDKGRGIRIDVSDLLEGKT